jgi:hypothetical protein
VRHQKLTEIDLECGIDGLKIGCEKMELKEASAPIRVCERRKGLTMQGDRGDDTKDI